MTVTFLHLFPQQLGLNGETGNLDCLVKRLQWSGIEARVVVFDGSSSIPENIDAVFIGSGTLAGALEALERLGDQQGRLRELASEGVPFFALGLGWEILGESIQLLDGKLITGSGIFPSRSVRTKERASAECFGFDDFDNLTTGYANHSAEIELFEGVHPLIQLKAGFGNSSMSFAGLRPSEGLIAGNLMASRLNGPLLPLNPHLADQFLDLVSKKSRFSYRQESKEAEKADSYATRARIELSQRLAR
ncbi:unannotated protein [freshwater metagenome]|uniref:Unannotated protein n=1 Tax=freshwater metagenome TaxID=449393 RepID=A0A6J6ITK0_9ZZZZ|nr:hypothetical protein [Actinomycetota bacterium]